MKFFYHLPDEVILETKWIFKAFADHKMIRFVSEQHGTLFSRMFYEAFLYSVIDIMRTVDFS